MTTANEALERLIDGNRRFVAGESRFASGIGIGDARRGELVAGQQPFAIVLGCSDSRVPAEIVFDQGLGDLFVIRVAGNVVAPSQIGSIEFAAQQFGTPLVVVLGHSHCGAVQATVDELRLPSEDRSPNLAAIVDRIRAPVQSVMQSGDDDTLLERAVRANVRESASHLRHGSAILEALIGEGRLAVVGAEYSLATGEVAFFEGVPLAG